MTQERKKKRTFSHMTGGISDEFKSLNFSPEEEKKDEDTDLLDFSGNNNSSSLILS